MLLPVKFSDDSWQLTKFLESACDLGEEKKHVQSIVRLHMFVLFLGPMYSMRSRLVALMCVLFKPRGFAHLVCVRICVKEKIS